MYTFYITNRKTGTEKIIFGYTAHDAYRRAKLTPCEWCITMREYTD